MTDHIRFAVVLGHDRAVLARYRSDLHARIPPAAVTVSAQVWEASLVDPSARLADDGRLLAAPASPYRIGQARAQALDAIDARAAQALAHGQLAALQEVHRLKAEEARAWLARPAADPADVADPVDWPLLAAEAAATGRTATEAARMIAVAAAARTGRVAAIESARARGKQAVRNARTRTTLDAARDAALAALSALSMEPRA